jgi:hypothetical protein
MGRKLVKLGLATMLIGLGLSGTEAAPTGPMSREALGLKTATTPAAMCGNSCRRGGRYIPGPPSVCAEEGLNYCGSSQGWGGPPGPPPGRGYGGYDGRGPYGRGPGYGGRAYGGGPETDGRGAYGRGSEPSGRGPGRRAQTPQQAPQQSPQQAPQGNPYGQGPGRCGSGLC